MQIGQTLILAGGFEGGIEDTAWTVTRTMPNDQDRVTKQPNPIYTCAAEETDTRLWYHVEKTTCTNIY